MITAEQDAWINHLSDQESVIIEPYDPSAPQKFAAVKQKVQEVLGTNARVLHRGATSFEISGQNEIDVYVPIPADQMDTAIETLISAFGSPRSRYPNERARFAVYEEGKRVDVFVINETCSGWINATKFDHYLRTHPEMLEQYRLHKEAGHGLSLREYYRRKTEFFNEVCAMADREEQRG